MAGLHTDKPILFICDPGGSYLTASNPNLISNLKINFLKILLDRAGLRGEEDPTTAAYIRIVDAPLIKVPFLSSLLLPPSSFNSPSPSFSFITLSFASQTQTHLNPCSYTHSYSSLSHPHPLTHTITICFSVSERVVLKSKVCDEMISLDGEIVRS